jgi:hypothetical protein
MPSTARWGIIFPVTAASRMTMIGSMAPIIMIDMSLSAPIMIIVGSTMRGFREIGAFGLALHR